APPADAAIGRAACLPSSRSAPSAAPPGLRRAAARRHLPYPAGFGPFWLGSAHSRGSASRPCRDGAPAWLPAASVLSAADLDRKRGETVPECCAASAGDR